MAHGAFLRQHSSDPELASHIMHDYKNADLDPQLRGILDFTTKLTVDPGSMQQTDVQGLRELGLSDEQVLSVVLITCDFNFMTRLADGLGVVFTDNAQSAVERWLTGPAKDQEWMMKQKV
ncbi:MAG: hypothetical protein IIB15_05055 [Chloroflexi bacterium]|nr:hypothetical protein [Chloroflexota bacterium]